MAPHSSTLAWKIPWTEEPGRLQSMVSLRVGHDWATSLSLSCIGEGNGNPLQYSCLENPRDGVTQSRTRLKWLSSSSRQEQDNENKTFRILGTEVHISQRDGDFIFGEGHLCGFLLDMFMESQDLKGKSLSSKRPKGYEKIIMQCYFNDGWKCYLCRLFT